MKKIITLFVTSLLAFTSCNSDDNDGQSSDSSILPKTSTYIDPEDASKNETTTISYNGNKVTKMESSYYRNVYTYTGDLITQTVQTEDYDDNVYTIVTEYTYTNDNKLATETHTTYSSQNTERHKSKYTYTYNSNGTIFKNYYYFDEDNKEVLSKQTATLTVANGNLVKIETYYDFDESTHTETYEYDNKNSFYKNILGMNKLYISTDGESGVNNLTKYTSSKYPSDNYTVQYTYNEQGFPTERKDYYGSELDGTYKVTY